MSSTIEGDTKASGLDSSVISVSAANWSESVSMGVAGEIISSISSTGSLRTSGWGSSALVSVPVSAGVRSGEAMDGATGTSSEWLASPTNGSGGSSSVSSRDGSSTCSKDILGDGRRKSPRSDEWSSSGATGFISTSGGNGDGGERASEMGESGGGAIGASWYASGLR